MALLLLVALIGFTVTGTAQTVDYETNETVALTNDTEPIAVSVDWNESIADPANTSATVTFYNATEYQNDSANATIALEVGKIVRDLLEHTGRRELFSPLTANPNVALVRPHSARIVRLGPEVLRVNTLARVLEHRGEELRQQLEAALRLDVTRVELDVDAVNLTDLILPREL